MFFITGWQINLAPVYTFQCPFPTRQANKALPVFLCGRVYRKTTYPRGELAISHGSFSRQGLLRFKPEGIYDF